MKIRTGFVSNSSSSSFVIHKSAFKNENDMSKFIDDLEKIRNAYDYRWGDSEKTFEVRGNMIFVEFNDVPKVFDIIVKYGISEDDPNVLCDYA